MDWKELVGFVAGFLTTVGMVPQIWRSFKIKSSYDISLIFSLTLTAGIGLWLYYGLMNGLMAVIIWNSIALILGFAMIYVKLKWGRE